MILCISPSELKEIKNCITSHDVWAKVETTYASKTPARKASLYKQLRGERAPVTNTTPYRCQIYNNQIKNTNEELLESMTRIQRGKCAVLYRLLYDGCRASGLTEWLDLGRNGDDVCRGEDDHIQGLYPVAHLMHQDVAWAA
uniref:Uncharacterized protein n=1 Tax=Trichogramma kaykai TaxID=54128 RepID=A0ABD2W1S5_9HYME